MGLISYFLDYTIIISEKSKCYMDARVTSKSECFIFAQVQIKNYPKEKVKESTPINC